MNRMDALSQAIACDEDPGFEKVKMEVLYSLCQALGISGRGDRDELTRQLRHRIDKSRVPPPPVRGGQPLKPATEGTTLLDEYVKEPSYSAPPSACHIWFDGSHIHLGFPPIPGHTKGHSIKIPIQNCEVGTSSWGAVPACYAGWAQMISVLKSRHDDASKKRPSSAGTRSAPIQYVLKNMLTLWGGEVKKVKEKADDNLSLEDLGL